MIFDNFDQLIKSFKGSMVLIINIKIYHHYLFSFYFGSFIKLNFNVVFLILCLLE